jgi:hypothetical protein
MKIRSALLIAAFALAGCAHGIRNLEDCGKVAGERRIECGACTLQNKAEGWLGIFEYQPDNGEGKRCVRVR